MKKEAKIPKLSVPARAVFLAMLASSQHSGQKLSGALNLLAEDDIDARLARVARLLAGHVADKPLSAAMALMPRTFDRATVDAVREAEQSGKLAETLDLLAGDATRAAELRVRWSLALSFPALALLATFFVLFIVMVFVIPSFKQVFWSFGADLPAPTLVLMTVSDWVTEFWYLFFGVPVALAVAIAMRSKYAYGRHIDQLLLWLPYYGDCVAKAHRARMTGVLADAVRHGLAPHPVLAYLRDSSANRVLAAQMEAMLNEAGAETSIVAWLAASKMAPRRLSGVAAFPRGAEQMARVLTDAAGQYADVAQFSVARLERGSFIWAYVIAGLIVGGSVIAMYLPIFKIGQAV